jgi:hypothetical protein
MMMISRWTSRPRFLDNSCSGTIVLHFIKKSTFIMICYEKFPIYVTSPSFNLCYSPIMAQDRCSTYTRLMREALFNTALNFARMERTGQLFSDI